MNATSLAALRPLAGASMLAVSLGVSAAAAPAMAK
jgi:hypothetical protein